MRLRMSGGRTVALRAVGDDLQLIVLWGAQKLDDPFELVDVGRAGEEGLRSAGSRASGERASGWARAHALRLPYITAKSKLNVSEVRALQLPFVR